MRLLREHDAGARHPGGHARADPRRRGARGDRGRRRGGARGRALGLDRAFLLGMVLFPAPLLLVPLASGPRPVVVAMLFTAEFLSGLGVMILDINVGALMMAFTPRNLLSLATATFRFVNYGVRPLGALAGRALGSLIGVRPTLFLATGCALAGVVWLLPSDVPGIRELPEEAA